MQDVKLVFAPGLLTSEEEISHGLIDPAGVYEVDRLRNLTTCVALYLNRRLRSEAIHDLDAVNYCT